MGWINLNFKTLGKPKTPMEQYYQEAQKNFEKTLKGLNLVKKSLKKTVASAMECKLLKNGDVKILLELNDKIEETRRKIIESYNKRKGEMWK